MFLRYVPQKLFVLMAALLFISACSTSESQPESVAQEAMDTLVTAEWLSQHLDDPDLVVLDCSVRIEVDENGDFRSVSGRMDYEKEHIPSAVFADLKGDLSDANSSLEYSLPTPEQFCAVMGALGVGDDSRVVLYDRTNSVWAARVWWMLRWVGFDNAALLDGGLNAWTAEGQELSILPATPKAKKLTYYLRPELIADRDEVFAAISDDAVSIIDVMPEAHFRGEMVLYDRPGHIPSASNIPTMSLLDESGRYRSHDELAALFTSDRKARAITYCGGGIAASSNAFIMHRLGFTDVAVYISSLQEWAADPANPLVTGDED